MKYDLTLLLNDDLTNLRSIFQQGGFDIRFVGGCVRDLLHGSVPHDTDLCTDATPDEQIALYDVHNIRHIETGLQHGTISVLMNDVLYEITSLRTDVETDGRHAVVAYTKDWIKDLERRDFTMNAMSLDFDGNLLDPFNGKKDLEASAVRFVNDATTRIKEDYLRILRWFRFRGRFGLTNVDPKEGAAIARCATGLNRVSKERIWSELSKIVSGDNGYDLLYHMHNLGVAEMCGLPNSHYLHGAEKTKELSNVTRNHITLLVSQYGRSIIDSLHLLKVSNNELALAVWLSNHREIVSNEGPFFLMAVEGVSREWALELAALQGMNPFDYAILQEWVVPEFPVNGFDLIKLGMKPGPDYGNTIKMLKKKWADSNYILKKEDLLKLINIPL